MEGAGGLLMRHIEALLSVSRDEMERRQKTPERVDLLALLDVLAGVAGGRGGQEGFASPQHRGGNAAPCPGRAGLLLDHIAKSRRQRRQIHRRRAVAIHVKRLSRRGSLRSASQVHDTGIGVGRWRRTGSSTALSRPTRNFATVGGSGLGLAIARRRLEACGGRSGEKRHRQGRAFLVRLAVGVDEAPA